MEFNATFIASAISFIVFVFIMNAIFYSPIQKIVMQRQKFIDEHYEEAKLNTAKSEAILKDKDRKLEKTKLEAKKIISEKSDEVKAQKASLTSEAYKKSAGKIEEAKGELNKHFDAAQSVLTGESEKLANIISKKILGGHGGQG